MGEDHCDMVARSRAVILNDAAVPLSRDFMKKGWNL